MRPNSVRRDFREVGRIYRTKSKEFQVQAQRQENTGQFEGLSTKSLPKVCVKKIIMSKWIRLKL